MSRIEAADAELRRGIDDQRNRHAARLVVGGIVAGGSVAATAQMLATEASSSPWRAIAAIVCFATLLLNGVLWYAQQTTDIKPVEWLDFADANGWTDERFRDEVVMERIDAFDDNEDNLQRSSALFVVSLLVGLLSIGLSTFLLIAERSA